jgi:hypothetical protein
MRGKAEMSESNGANVVPKSSPGGFLFALDAGAQSNFGESRIVQIKANSVTRMCGAASFTFAKIHLGITIPSSCHCLKQS